MPYATTFDNARLYYEEAGSGMPILFVHEFAGDHRGWEPQMRYFARSHRCIAYSARGYTPSEVPKDPAAYSYQHFMRDMIAMLDHLGLDKAHIVGLSMGGYTAVQVGINHPDRALSLTAAGAGSGSERWLTDEFRLGAQVTAEQFETKGAAEVANTYGLGPGRVPFQIKDPRGYAEFSKHFSEHDAQGSANTMRKFQGERPSLYDFEAEIRRIVVPTLIVVGDEDDPCVEPSLLLKQWIAPSGLAVFPKTGHVVNLEEPDLFNRTLAEFLARVEAGRWGPRDPLSVRAREHRPAT
jgi:3-oxoadipate enol-lactonase